MAIRKLVLGSAASVLLSGAVIAAAPALAQPDIVVVDRHSHAAIVIDDPSGDAVVIAEPADEDIVVIDRHDDFAARLLMTDVPPLVRVEDVIGVNDALFNAPVLDAAGLPVGHFRRIEVKAPGDLVAVVTLNGSRRTISMLTEHVRADPERKVIVADLTAREIDLIPSGFPYG